jgi:alkylation response protein AidB-like acyl-CoA dehydrogenase
VAIESALTSMRIHGAMGYSTELDVERLYRDAPLMAIGEGTNDILRLVIARGLLGASSSATGGAG